MYIHKAKFNQPIKLQLIESLTKVKRRTVKSDVRVARWDIVVVVILGLDCQAAITQRGQLANKV